MLISDLIKEIDVIPNACDTVKFGDSNKELTGVVVTMWATPNVIRRAAELRANLIITHEPTFYDDNDKPLDNPVDKAKHELILNSGVVIFRYHTAMHRFTPDLIPAGAFYYLGLEGELSKTKYFGSSIFTLKEPISANEIADLFKEKLGVKHIRIAGNGDFKAKTIGACLGSPAGVFEILRDDNTDVVLVGEAREYTQCEYARDAAELGINKAVVTLGHEGSERAGMRYLAKLLSDKHPELQIDYVECGEVYN
jgi:putative NIF3 family GTP cyclohydrolase 1 type 2